MQKHLLLACAATLVLAAAPAAGQAPAAPRPPKPADELVITNVNVIDVDAGAIEPDRMVVMRDGVILSVGDWVPAGRGVPRVDGQGLYLIPGLWDGHAHALTTEAEERVALPLYVAHGVTSIREMNTTRPLPQLLATYQALELGERVGPRFELGGPLLDGGPDARPGRLAGRAEGKAYTHTLLKAGWCSLQAGPLLPREAYLGAASAATDGLALLVGSVPESVTALEAVAAGQRGFDDTGKLVLGCSLREVELVQARAKILPERHPAARLSVVAASQQADIAASFRLERCTALGKALAESRAFVVPRLVANDFDLQLDPAPENPRFRSVPAAQRQQWAQAALLREHRTAQEVEAIRGADFLQRLVLREFQRQGVRIVAGSDAGSGRPNLFYGGSLLEELERLVAAGFKPWEALRAATSLAARAAGQGYLSGRIQEGYQADVVLLRANPLDDIRNLRQVQAVVLRGRLLDLPALAALAAEAEQAALGAAPAEKPAPAAAAR